VRKTNQKCEMIEYWVFRQLLYAIPDHWWRQNAVTVEAKLSMLSLIEIVMKKKSELISQPCTSCLRRNRQLWCHCCILHSMQPSISNQNCEYMGPKWRFDDATFRDVIQQDSTSIRWIPDQMVSLQSQYWPTHQHSDSRFSTVTQNWNSTPRTVGASF
jgi:hypothetical protein